MNLSDDMIEKAIQQVGKRKPRHEHNDCIRMAFAWLDAQKTTERTRTDDWKHIIERWCGRYITDDDVQVAAILHKGISGSYPRFNISSRLVFPSTRRLRGIGEAGKHNPLGDVGLSNDYYSFEPGGVIP